MTPNGSGGLFGTQPFNVLDIAIDGSGAINGEFFEIDQSNFTNFTALSGPGGDVEGLAFGGSGTIFGLEDGGDLLSYDIGTDTWSTIGNTGIDFDQIGLAFASDLGVLFAVGNQDSNLYSINPLTAASTLIGDTGIGSGGGLAYVQAVPLPAPIFFLLSGLIGLTAVGRARARA
ncbi:MAG: hypothetical protein AAGC81_11215 [Pseudomonadota bacterium]